MPDSRATMERTPLAAAAAGLDACVHCGFCLTACPTYLTLEDENDSPRGRLVLMRAMLDGDVLPSDPDAAQHIDRCLGCRGCETACPSGVPYGHLLEATRATMAESRPLPWRARLILAVFARRRLLSVALAAARAFRWTRIPDLIGRMRMNAAFPFAMLASTRRTAAERRASGRRAVVRRTGVNRGAGAGGTAPARERTALLTGCVMEGLFTPVNRATERALTANGYEVVPAKAQVCCGALHAHAGDVSAARELARRNIAAFEQSGADLIAVNSAGCGAMLKEYAHLLRDDDAWRDRAAAVASRVRDISELLAASGPARVERRPVRVAYDAPCHLVHGQRVTAEPLAVLNAIQGVTLVPLAGSELCCGSAGIYNLIEPDVAGAVLAPKVAAIAESGAEIVATGNPGCLMQIGAGLLRSGHAVRARHPVELLAGARPAAPSSRA